MFLTATLVLSILAAFGLVRWQLAAVTGGLSLAQFVGAFFTQPSADLQRNLTNLAVFKMILESHSLKTAFARFHLTTPQALRELQTKGEGERRRAPDRGAAQGARGDRGVDRADFERCASSASAPSRASARRSMPAEQSVPAAEESQPAGESPPA